MEEVLRQREISKWLNVQLAPVIKGLPPNLMAWYGMDFARSGDLSAIAVLIEEQNLHRHCPVIVELRNVPFKVQQQILFYLLTSSPTDSEYRIQSGIPKSRLPGFPVSQTLI